MTDHKVDTNVLLKLTTDCFSRMNNNIKSKAARNIEQRGGGSQLILDSIIPYLVSTNARKISGSTKVPEAILYTTTGRAQGRFDRLIRIDSTLNRNDIITINNVLSRRPDSY